VRGIVVDDHLVDLREAVLVALAQTLVLHAEAPMRVAVREAAVRRDLVHLVVAQHLEHDREEIQAVAPSDRLDLLLLDEQVARQVGLVRRDGHYLPFPRKSLMLETMASRSRISLVITRSSSVKCSRRSF